VFINCKSCTDSPKTNCLQQLITGEDNIYLFQKTFPFLFVEALVLCERLSFKQNTVISHLCGIIQYTLLHVVIIHIALMMMMLDCMQVTYIRTGVVCYNG